MLALPLNTFCVNFFKKLAIHHCLKMIILRKELMRFIIMFVMYWSTRALALCTGRAVKLHKVHILKNILINKNLFEIHALLNRHSVMN